MLNDLHKAAYSRTTHDAGRHEAAFIETITDKTSGKKYVFKRFTKDGCCELCGKPPKELSPFVLTMHTLEVVRLGICSACRRRLDGVDAMELEGFKRKF
jgi:hypothetical protein